MSPIAHLLNATTGTDSGSHLRDIHGHHDSHDHGSEEQAVSPLSPRSYPSPRSNSSSSCEESQSSAGVLANIHTGPASPHGKACVASSPLSTTGMRSASTPSSSDEDTVHLHRCQWKGCSLEFTSPELLYHHLCQDHVGRKSQKNLQLNCQWGDCQTKTVKRDHITSHLRVHVQLKPFACSTCNKKFKRPQDLKKHLKVHNEELSLLKKKRGPKPSNKLGKISNDRSRAHQRFTLPSISLDKFIHEEVKTQQPVYSQQLAEKMAIVLLLPVNNNNATSPPSASSASSTAVSPNLVSHHMVLPYQTQQRPLVGHGAELRSAVGFFNNLSMDMSRNYANNNLPTANLGPNPVPAPQSYPLIPKLPSISARPNVGAPPPVLSVFNRFDTHQTSPSSSSSAFYPQHYSNNYSLHQRTALLDAEANEDIPEKDNVSLEESFTSLNLSSEEQDLELFYETYSTVKLVKDYLLCELMEELDEFKEEEEEQGFTSFDEFSDSKECVIEGRIPSNKISLSKYPQVVI